MTFLEMLSEAKTMLQTDGESYILDADIKKWLNSGYKEIVNQIGGLEQLYSDLSVTGQAGYAIPSSVIAIKSLKYNDVFLDQVDYNDLSTTSGNPASYAILGNYYYLGPKPATGGKTVILNCKTTTTNMSADSDTPNLPDYFHKYIVEYAIYQGKLKGNDLTAYANLMSLWTATIKKAYGTRNRRKGVKKMKIKEW